MFKKVIGQEGNESQGSLESTLEERAAQPGSTSQPSPPASSLKAPAGNTRNVLSSDVEIKGTVKFQHDLIVDGKIDGEIQSTGNLTVGENARIKAEVKTGSVIVYGKIHGNILATDHVELKSSAEIVGDIKAKTITIEAGAIFVGKSTIGTPSQGSATPTPAASPKPAAPKSAAPAAAVSGQE